MKTIIFTGPAASGKTTAAHRILMRISHVREHHLHLPAPHADEEDLLVQLIGAKALRGIKAVLLDGARPPIIERVGMALSELGFKGTYIAVTRDRFVAVSRLIALHQVEVRHLHPNPDGLIKDNIIDAITPIARLQGATLTRGGHPHYPSRFRYVFPDGTVVYIKEGGQA